MPSSVTNGRGVDNDDQRSKNFHVSFKDHLSVSHVIKSSLKFEIV